MEKRGIGHIEAVLSFIIFFTAVGFSIFFFFPSTTSGISSTTLDYISDNLLASSNTEIYEYYIKIEPEASSSNYPSSTQIDLNIPFNPDLSSVALLVSNPSTEIPSRIVSNSGNSRLYLDLSSQQWDTEKMVFVRIGKNIGNNAFAGIPDSSEGFLITSSNSYNLSNYELLKYSKEAYDTDPSLFKDEFFIPQNIGFGFNLTMPQQIDSLGTKRIIPAESEIISRNIKLILLKDNEIIQGGLNIFIWN